MSKLYLLEQTGDYGHDEFVAKLIRAKNRKSARKIANITTGDEGHIWQDAKLVSCKIVKPEGKEGIIIDDFNAG